METNFIFTAETQRSQSFHRDLFLKHLARNLESFASVLSSLTEKTAEIIGFWFVETQADKTRDRLRLGLSLQKLEIL
jgi:hypothetical protein